MLCWSKSTIALAAALILAPALSARAQPNDAQSAVVLAKEARQHYDHGDWQRAKDLFVAANEHAHSPVLSLHIARCERNLGHFVAAREVYRRMLSEPVAAGAPPQFLEARADAERDLAGLPDHIGQLVIVLAGAKDAGAVQLDGRELAASELGAPVDVDPGFHLVRVVRDGRELARVELTLKEREQRTVPIDLGPKPSSPVVKRPPFEMKRAPPPEPGSVLPGIVTLVPGVLALGAGVGARVVALQKIDGVRERCVGTHCLAADESEVQLAKDLQTASTVLWIAGGAVTVTGIVLLVVRPGGEPPRRVDVRASLGTLELSGTF